MELFLVLLVLFVAVTVHAALGFGTALIAMPFLTVLLGLPAAAPLVALVMTLTIAISLYGAWQHVDVRSAATLLGFSVLGMPLGGLLLRHVDVTVGQAGLGVILLVFAAFSLLNVTWTLKEHRAGQAVAGLLGGCFGAAYNTNAPPVVVYGSLVRWPPDRFRGTLQGFFLPSTLLICATHAGFGLWTAPVLSLFVWSVPVIVAACWVGRRFSQILSRRHFERAVHLVSGVMGAGLIARAILSGV